MAFFSITDHKYIEIFGWGSEKTHVKTTGDSFEEKHFPRFLRILNRTYRLSRLTRKDSQRTDFLCQQWEWCSAGGTPDPNACPHQSHWLQTSRSPA